MSLMCFIRTSLMLSCIDYDSRMFAIICPGKYW